MLCLFSYGVKTYALTVCLFFFFKQKTAYEMRISDWSSDVCASDLMRNALALLHRRSPELEVEGEMHADAALDEAVREKIFPNSKLKGAANLLVMPTLDAANIAFHLVKVLGQGLSVGPILLGVGSEERRVGKGCVSTGRTRWSP